MPILRSTPRRGGPSCPPASVPAAFTSARERDILAPVSTVKKITTPLSADVIADLRSGDEVEISGKVYTARDAAHKRLVEMIDRGDDLPFDLAGSVIFYVGPSPEPPGRPIGSAGPTTAYRMDAYAPILIKNGLKGMIGKGGRNDEVKTAILEHKAVYFGAIGGAAALLARSIKTSKTIAFAELGAEAVREIEVDGFPAVVVNDVYGGDLYEEGTAKYRA